MLVFTLDNAMFLSRTHAVWHPCSTAPLPRACLRSGSAAPPAPGRADRRLDT